MQTNQEYMKSEIGATSPPSLTNAGKVRDLEIELSQRVGELKVSREDNTKLLAEKRAAQDLLVVYASEIASLRKSAVLLESRVSNERAAWEGLGGAIAKVLRLWSEHSGYCDSGCVASIPVSRSLAETLADCTGPADLRQVVRLWSPAVLFRVALEEHEPDVASVIGNALADAVRNGVRLYWPCGHATSECNWCAKHEECAAPESECAICQDSDAADYYDNFDREDRL